uniref:Uncharacterized protein n=1 Tax=Knipowitschia caucasica TaxID=637954 RepID=A0AAV2JUF1_KNICA
MIALSLPLHTLLQPQVLPRQGSLPPQALQPWTAALPPVSSSQLYPILQLSTFRRLPPLTKRTKQNHKHPLQLKRHPQTKKKQHQ